MTYLIGHPHECYVFGVLLLLACIVLCGVHWAASVIDRPKSQPTDETPESEP